MYIHLGHFGERLRILHWFQHAAGRWRYFAWSALEVKEPLSFGVSIMTGRCAPKLPELPDKAQRQSVLPTTAQLGLGHQSSRRLRWCGAGDQI
jgi:hypothetical protein